MFLDAFAHHRHAHGQTGTTINWNAIEDVDNVMRAPEVRDKVIESGLTLLPSVQACDVLQRSVAQVPVASVDWQKWAEIYPALATPLLSGLLSQVTQKLRSRNGQRQASGDELSAQQESFDNS